MDRSRIIKGPSDGAKRERAKQLRRATTPAEKKLWHFLRMNKREGIHFGRQQVIDGFIADFFCYRAGLVREVDGGIHDEQREYDEERSLVFAARGLRVMRLANARSFNDFPACLDQIAVAARSHND